MREAAETLLSSPPCPPDGLPASQGAYALLCHLAAPLTFPWRKQAAHLDIGWYVYAGSAYGAGGIKARVGHHLRRGKRPHWHIDHLTNQAAAIKVIARIGGSECEIVGRLIGSGQFHAPIAGFGSSDCRHCPAHLLRYSGWRGGERSGSRGWPPPSTSRKRPSSHAAAGPGGASVR